jgi:selenocysteine lyase/cysteine desulfurase
VLAVSGATVYGVTDRARLDQRVPTVSFAVDGVSSSTIATHLASRGIGARSGHMYAPRLMQRLGLMPEGTVRVSLVHYNSLAEIARFGTALGGVVAEARSGRYLAGEAPVGHR